MSLGTFCPLGRFVPWDVLYVHHKGPMLHPLKSFAVLQNLVRLMIVNILHILKITKVICISKGRENCD